MGCGPVDGGSIPPASAKRSDDFSGKLVLRLPRTVHARAAYWAKKEGISLNQFILAALAQEIGALDFNAEAEDTPRMNRALRITGIKRSRD